MKSIWVIDTETSNNGIWHPEPGGHIVEFGAVKVDLDSGKLGRSYTGVIHDPQADPEAWVFRNTDLTLFEVTKGINPTLFAHYLSKQLDGQMVTAYNVDFDRLMIRRDMPELDSSVKWGPCIMQTAARIGDIPKRHAGKNTFPTAEASYNYLCPDDPCDLKGVERHRASADAKMEAHILIRLYERGLFDVGGTA